jgi:2-dehydropantoate 2-reductase
MRVVVVGAGGVGGYFGGQLAAAGHDVVFIARGRQLKALAERGLRVDSEYAPVSLPQVSVTDDLAATGPADLVLIAVKLWETENVARQLVSQAAGGAAILSLQNGVQKDETLQRHLQRSAVLGGACYISAAIASPGVIRHNGELARVVFGEYDGRRSERALAIEAALSGAGIDTELTTDITGVLWRKFVFLVGLSSTTSAARQPIGVLRANPLTRRLLREVMAEVAAVARARGVDVPEAYADEQVTFTDTLPAGMSSSMLHDLSMGHRLELPWLGGAVVAMGEQAGVATPYNRALAAVLEPYAAGN